MAGKWFVKQGDKVFGPFATDRLRQFASEGKVRPKSLVAESNAGPWLTADRIEGLFPIAIPATTLEAAQRTADGNSSYQPHGQQSEKPSSPESFRGTPQAAGSTPPKPVQGFWSWYSSKWGKQSLPMQAFNWLLGGYLLFPAMWSFSEHAPLKVRRWAYLMGMLLSLSGVLTGAISAYQGKSTDVTYNVSERLQYARRGDRILLNELEKKTDVDKVETERKATGVERSIRFCSLYFLFVSQGPVPKSGLHSGNNRITQLDRNHMLSLSARECLSSSVLFTGVACWSDMTLGPRVAVSSGPLLSSRENRLSARPKNPAGG